MRFEQKTIFFDFFKNVQICRHFGTPFVIVFSRGMTYFKEHVTFIDMKTLRVLLGFSVSEKLSSCEDTVIQSLLVINLFCVNLIKARQCEFLNLRHMTSYVGLLVE